MNRFRLLAIGTMLIVALTAPAQQTATGPGGTDKNEHGQRAAQGDVPTVGQQPQGPHSEMHGNLRGATSSPPQPPQI